MALFRTGELGINDEYKLMLEARKTIQEAVTSNNSIHEETERLIKELSSDEININPEELEERLKDLEKNELTSLDKKVITNIRKNIDIMKKAQESFEAFTKKLKYDYVVTKKDSSKQAEEELEGEDNNLETDMETEISPEETAVPADEFKPEETI